jgi:hypothetical protein
MAKQPAYIIVNKRTKTVYAYSRKLDAVYHHCNMRYRPFIKFIELNCQSKLSSYKGYTIKGDF